MYASLSSDHFPVAREPHIETTFSGGSGDDAVSVSFHCGHNLYLSFTPDEARRIAESLGVAAAEAAEAQGRIDAFSDNRETEGVAA